MKEKKEITEEMAARERRLASEKKERDARERKKQRDRERRLVKKANEVPSRITIKNDEYGNELIMTPHKFPRNLEPPMGVFWLTICLLPFIIAVPIVIKEEFQYNPSYTYIAALAYACVFLVWVVGYAIIIISRIETFRLRVTKDGNIYFYGKNPKEPLGTCKKNKLSAGVVISVGEPWGRFDIKWPGMWQHLKVRDFNRKDIEKIKNFLEENRTGHGHP
ncbi:hypothetical protein ES705_26291 [subsurface metagenome]